MQPKASSKCRNLQSEKNVKADLPNHYWQPSSHLILNTFNRIVWRWLTSKTIQRAVGGVEPKTQRHQVTAPKLMEESKLQV